MNDELMVVLQTVYGLLSREVYHAIAVQFHQFNPHTTIRRQRRLQSRIDIADEVSGLRFTIDAKSIGISPHMVDWSRPGQALVVEVAYEPLSDTLFIAL